MNSKKHLTIKGVKAKYPYIVKIPYEHAHFLLNAGMNYGKLTYKGHTQGVYGWNSDIYEVTPTVAISTGYRPFGNYQIEHKVLIYLEVGAERNECDEKRRQFYMDIFLEICKLPEKADHCGTPYKTITIHKV